MTNSDYLGLGLAAVMLAIGVPAVLGRVRSMPQHRGWLAFSMGAATLLYIILESRDVPGETWLQWVVPLLTTVGLLIAWRGDRHAAAKEGRWIVWCPPNNLDWSTKTEMASGGGAHGKAG